MWSRTKKHLFKKKEKELLKENTHVIKIKKTRNKQITKNKE